MEIKKSAKQKIQIIGDFLYFLAKRAKSDAVFRVASSLAYTSLIAVVPIIAIGVAVFSAFPVFDEIREQLTDFLFQNLTPSFEEEIRQYLEAVVKKSAQLGAVGVTGIAITAIVLLWTIENSFNYIFKVTQPRRIATKITLYWTVITLGPLLLGAAVSMRGYLYALQKIMPVDLETGKLFISYMIPQLITVITLVLVYILVPNKKVSFTSACCGAMVAVILFWFMRICFGSFVMSNTTYSTLYGALAIIPIFLIWMYLAWAVVLFGAVFTAALDEYNQLGETEIKKIIIAGKKGHRL